MKERNYNAGSMYILILGRVRRVQQRCESRNNGVELLRRGIRSDLDFNSVFLRKTAKAGDRCLSFLGITGTKRGNQGRNRNRRFSGKLCQSPHTIGGPHLICRSMAQAHQLCYEQLGSMELGHAGLRQPMGSEIALCILRLKIAQKMWSGGVSDIYQSSDTAKLGQPIGGCGLNNRYKFWNCWRGRSTQSLKQLRRSVRKPKLFSCVLIQPRPKKRHFQKNSLYLPIVSDARDGRGDSVCADGVESFDGFDGQSTSSGGFQSIGPLPQRNPSVVRLAISYSRPAKNKCYQTTPHNERSGEWFHAITLANRSEVHKEVA